MINAFKMKKKSFISLLILVFVFTSLTLGGCGSSNEGETSEGGNAPTEKQVVKVGILGPYSGPSAQLSNYYGPFEAYFKELEAKGGIPGYKFEVVRRDDEGNPAKSVQLLKELIEKENCVAVLAPANSSNVLADLPVIFQNKVPLFVTPATSDMIDTEALKLAEQGDGTNYVFRQYFTNNAQCERIAKFIIDHNYTKIAVLGDTTAYGKDGTEVLVNMLKKEGIDPVLYELYTANTPDLSPQIIKAKNSGADLLFVWGLGPDMAHAALARDQIGWDVPLLGANAMVMSNYYDLAKEAAQDTYCTYIGKYFAEEGQPLPEDLMAVWEVYHNYFPDGYEAKDLLTGFCSWDAAAEIAEAVSVVGPDPAAIAKYVHETTFSKEGFEALPEGMFGIISADELKFTEDKHHIWTSDTMDVIEVYYNSDTDKGTKLRKDL